MDRDRYAAYKALLSIEKEDTWSNLAIAAVLAGDGSNIKSPGFVRELVYGVTENRLYLDYFLDRLARKGISGLDPRVLTILRMGLYQISFMDSVPEHAAVSSSTELAKKCAPGREKFVNGMLRGFLRNGKDIALPDPGKDPAGYLSVRWSCHPELAAFLMDTFGYEDAGRFLAFTNGRGETGVRVNLSKLSVQEAAERLAEAGIEASPSALSDRVLIVKGGNVTDTDLFKDGEISIQSEGSCWIADVAGARPGETVMDMCAAPGGKTLAMAEMMEGKGVIRAFDIHPHRVDLIRVNAGRTGASNVIAETRDASEPIKEYEGTADLVLLDVPCSGLGVIREKPEIKLRAFDLDVPGLAETQERMLRVCSAYPKKGGRLLYSTCTVNPAENGERVRSFLSGSGEYELRYERTILPQTDGTDGFYAAMMVRKDQKI